MTDHLVAGTRRSFHRAFRRGQVAVFAGLAMTIVASGAGGDADSLAQAWEKAARLLTNDAQVEFERLREKGGAEARAATFGTALMLLNVQPKTEGNIQRAAVLLDEVAAAREDDLSALAGYYRARIEQTHRLKPEREKAVELFTQLIERYPTHPAAQFAVVKRALIEIYDGSPREEKRRRMELLAQTASNLTYAPARRDLHMLLADSYARLFQDDEQALKHLLAADQAGIVRSKSRGSVWVRIGELAGRLGRTDVATEYYRRFLATYRRDSRHYTIEQRLKTLGAGTAP